MPFQDHLGDRREVGQRRVLQNSPTIFSRFSVYLTAMSLCGFPGGSVVKNLPAIGQAGLILQLERCPGEGNGNPLKYSCLGNLMDRGDWWATVHRVAKESDWISDYTTKINLWLSLFIIKSFKKKVNLTVFIYFDCVCRVTTPLELPTPPYSLTSNKLLAYFYIKSKSNIIWMKL